MVFVGSIIFIFSLPLVKLFSFSNPFILSSSVVMALLTDALFVKAAINSVAIAFSSAFLAIILGLFLALFVGLMDNHRTHIWSFMMFILFFLPPTFLAISWIDVGILINRWFRIPNPIYTQMATIILLAIHLFPVGFFIILDQVKRIPCSMIESARVCGTSPFRLLGGIILPLLRSSIVKAFMLIWFSCLGHFTFFALLGIPGKFTTLTTFIYARLISFGVGQLEDIVLICVLLLLIGLGGTFFFRKLSGPSWHFKALLKRQSYNIFRSRLSRILTYGVMVIIMLCVILPMINLLMTSFTMRGKVNFAWKYFSFENYVYIFENRNIHYALFNSLFLGTATAILLFFNSIIFEYGALIARRRFFARARLFFQSLYLMPGSVLGIGLILFFLKPFKVLSFLHLTYLYNTLSMILFAYVMRFFAFHMNIANAAAQSFSIRLIESAKSCGAEAFQTMRRIFLPLVSPGLLNGSFLVFILIIHEVTISSLLPSSDTQTIGVVLLSLMEHGETKATAALCILVMGMLAIIRIVAYKLTQQMVKTSYNLSSHDAYQSS